MAILKIPGMTDPHTHLRDLDWSHKATFASETAAALAGGYTLVMDMPNTTPATLDRAALDRKLDAIIRQAVCDWGVYFGASKTGNWDEYPKALPDVCGLKIFNNPTTGNLFIEDQAQRELHYQHWSGSKPIAVHAEEETVLDILELVRKYRKPTHFCHICSANEIRYLTAAKAEGLPITIGVTPHHLYLSEDDLPSLGALGLMKPELKTRADQAALWAAIQNGVVDVVESDHAPHTLAEKASDKPPYGVPGLETTLPLLCQSVKEGRLSADRLIALLAINPRRIFGVPQDEGTYTLVDLDTEFIIERQNLRTQPGWSPFEGMRVCGKVREVWIRAIKVFDGENVLVAPGFGVNRFKTR